MIYCQKDVPLYGCFCETPSLVFDSTTHFDVCQNCGVCVEMILNEAPEYGYSGDGQDISYVSCVPGHSFNFADDPLKHKLQETNMSGDDVREQEMKKTIYKVCDAFHIYPPHIIRDQAIFLAKSLEEKFRLKGKKRIASYAVAVYFSCKLNDAFRELRLFSSLFGIDIKAINAAHNAFKEYLSDIVTPKRSPHEPLICSTIFNFDLDPPARNTLRKSVLNMVDQYPEIFESSRKPRTIIAALILINAFLTDTKISVRTIAEGMKICHSSIVTCAKEISKEHGIAF